MALSQAQRDAKRKTTLVRIETALLNIIRKFARKNKTTIQQTIAGVLRARFGAPK